MVLVLKEGVPSFDKRRRIDKKATNVLADHLVRRKSQDRRGGRVGIQTSSRIFEVCESEAAFMGRVRIWDSSQAAAYHQEWTFFGSIFAVSVIKDKIRSLVGCRAVRYRTFNIRLSIK